MTAVTMTGPAFDGRAKRTADVMTDEIEVAVGEEAFDMVHLELDLHLRNPTGYYESQVVVDRARGDVVVHDSGVVYGPWLEGVSSRNERSRFKGYASFRRATQRVQGQVGQIAAPIVTRRVAGMNR